LQKFFRLEYATYETVDNGQRQAVEVTTLHEYFEHEGKEYPRLAFEKAIHSICYEAETKLKGSLSNRIDAVISFPISKQQERSLFKEIEKFANADSGKTIKLFGRTDCWLSSFEDNVPRIRSFTIPSAKSIIPRMNKIGANIRASIDYAVKRILIEKSERLTSLSSFNERVLIIFSYHTFGSAERVQISIDKQKTRIKGINKIFLANNEQIEEITI